jgi:hypothetical protein
VAIDVSPIRGQSMRLHITRAKSRVFGIFIYL